jgi:hypothetical protein
VETWWEAGSPELVVRMSPAAELTLFTGPVLEGLRRLAPAPSWHAQELKIEVTTSAAGALLPSRAFRCQRGVLSEVRLMPGLEYLEDAAGTRYLSWPDAGVFSWVPHRGRARLMTEPERADLEWMAATLVGTGLHLSGAARGLHAAVVQWGHRNVIIAGPSGSGKTSLALLVALHGGLLLAEDFCYLDATGNVAPVSLRDFVTLRAGTFRWLEGLLAERLPRSFPVPESNGNAADLLAQGRSGQVRLPLRLLSSQSAAPAPVPVHAVVFSAVRPVGSAVEVTTVQAGDAHQRLVSATDARMFDWMRDLLIDDVATNAIRLSPQMPCIQLRFGIEATPQMVLARLLAATGAT